MVYDQPALQRIAGAIGPCLEGRDRGEMLENIDRAAQDFITTDRDYNAKRRDVTCTQLEAAGAPANLLKYIGSGGQDLPLEPEPAGAADRQRLQSAAMALRKADHLLGEMGPIGAGHLAWEQVERGLKLPAGYLAGLADAVEAAAHGLPVKPGPEPSAFDRFIVAIARIVEHYAGWSAAYTYDDLEEAYTGPFLEVVKACAEPLGVKKKEPALAKAIHRAFSRDRLSA